MVIFGCYTKKKSPASVSLHQHDSMKNTRIIDLQATINARPHALSYLHLIAGGPVAVVSSFRHLLYFVVAPSPSSGESNDHQHADRREPH